MNVITSGQARSIINTECGVNMSKEVFRRVFSLMIEMGHAEASSSNGMPGLVQKDKVELWVNYVEKRKHKIANREWKTNRPYSVKDFEDINRENSNLV